MCFEVFNKSEVRTFLQQLLTQDKYKKIMPPESLKNNYYLDNKFAFFIGFDAFCKFEQIINEESITHEYVEQLKRIFDKFSNYSEIKKGIYSLLAKIIAVKLDIKSHNLEKEREKILSYIYDKYIVNGYFYFGISSNYINELKYVGIRRDGFILDPKLEKINKVFRKTRDHDLFTNYNENISITDDILIALYYAFLSPDYLYKMLDSIYLKNSKCNKDCFYEKDIKKIKEILIDITNKEKLNNEDKHFVVNTFIDVFTKDKVLSLTPTIALIKRKALGKNKLKDIHEIIDNKDTSLTSSIALILESRYHSLTVNEDILPFNIEIHELPKYLEFLLGINNYAVITNSVDIDINDLKLDNNDIRENVGVNSYGATSLQVVATIIFISGIISVILGIILEIIK